MNIMGIGPQEMMVIAVIALLIFGPGKLPEVMGQAGKLYRDFRRMSGDLSKEFESTLAEARNLTKEFEAEVSGLSKEVNELTQGVQKDLGIKGANSSKGKRSTSKSSSSKSGSTSKSTSRTSSSKAGSSKAKTSASKSSTSSTTKPIPGAKATTSVAKKPPAPVASREDPDADVSFFDPAPVERKARTRRAVPSVIADPTPRTAPLAETGGGNPASDGAVAAADDALARARARRRSAGYAQPTA